MKFYKFTMQIIMNLSLYRNKSRCVLILLDFAAMPTSTSSRVSLAATLVDCLLLTFVNSLITPS